MYRSAALDQRVQGFARVGAPEPLPVPGMPGVAGAAQRFVALARSGTFLPAATGRPQVEVPARAVVEREVAGALRRVLAQFRQPRHERKLPFVFFPNLARFRLGLADHLGELAQAGAVDAREVAVLGALPVDAGPRRHQRVEVGRRVVAVALDRLARTRQLVAGGGGGGGGGGPLWGGGLGPPRPALPRGRGAAHAPAAARSR